MVIEHNLDVIKMADHIIELGPDGGNNGGKIINKGTPEEIMLSKNGYTATFLKEELIKKNDMKKIEKAFENKNWNEIKSEDSWQIFKIMSEFVQAFENLAKIGPCVSIFGSARTKSNNIYYKIAEDIAKKLTQKGYGVITGGGLGIMEAGNKGAKKGNGKICRIKY